ncbi:MAG: CoA transferase [Candidatus Latescibacterota bacterium]|nr:CoA transferase [Candidatus Latescibacterota bacterium]
MNKTGTEKWALDGIKVVDFGHYVAGPLTGMLLADQGADVVKVDRPGNPEVESLERSVYDRGKRRIQIDLKTEAGLAMAEKLIDVADVVIENFRPGVMDRLGLGPNKMTLRNPGLVYLSEPGFASTDEKASVRTFEGVIGAATAQYMDLKPGGSEVPIYTPIGLGSTYAAIHGAIAVVLALYRREDTGHGDVIEVSLAGAAMSAMAVLLMKADDPPLRYVGRGPSPFMGSFQCGDGKWIFWIASGHSRNTIELCKAIDIYNGLIADGMVDLPVYSNLGLEKNLPDSCHLTQEWNEEISKRMQDVLWTRPAAEWVRIVNDAGVPCALHRTAQEWLDARETDESALTIEVENERYGKVRQFGAQVDLSDSPEFVPSPPKEYLGDWKSKGKTSDVVGGGSMEPILKGLRVLDLSNVLAGPASARTLAEYGAEVIKIDTMNPYFGPRVFSWFPMEVSPGKRSLLLNLKDSRGREIFDRLVEISDVIVHNFRPGVADRLGIGYERIHKLNTRLTYRNITAMDGPKVGAWGNRPGFDPMVQAATGIQVRYGGEGKPPVLHGWASCIDYITGYSGTYGVVLALLRQKRCGPSGALVRTSLAMGSQLVQAPLMFSAEGHPTGGEPQGQKAVGEHSLHRTYQTCDGWIFLGGAEQDVQRLTVIPGLEDVPISPDEEENRARLLKDKIVRGTVEEWVNVFVLAGFGCHRVDNIEDLRRSYLHDVKADGSGVWDDGRSISAIRVTDHPAGTEIDICPPAYARFRRTVLHLCTAGPAMGEHTREILKELGFVDREIDGFVSEGAVKEFFSEHYLPR